jgi:hypothetical protein
MTSDELEMFIDETSLGEARSAAITNLPRPDLTFQAA